MKKAIFILGLVGLFVAFVLTQLLRIASNEQVIRILEKTIALDGTITCVSCVAHKMTSLIVVMGVIWVFLFLDNQGWDRYKIKPLKNYMKAAYLITLSLIVAWFAIKDRELYVEDHFFEQMTVGFLLIASVIFVTKSTRPGTLNRWLLLFGAMALFVLGMEEISWGQRIFNWQTTGVMTQVNYQNETNLHNIFNPIIHNVYSAVCLLLGYFLISLNPLREKLSRFAWWKIVAPFFPSNDFAIFGLVYLFLSGEVAVYGGELTEEIFSVFAAAYAIFLFG